MKLYCKEKAFVRITQEPYIDRNYEGLREYEYESLMNKVYKKKELSNYYLKQFNKEE